MKISVKILRNCSHDLSDWLKSRCVLAAVITSLIAGAGCGPAPESQDFESNLCYWLCRRDQNEFTCTFDEFGEFQTTGGNPGQSYTCPECNKNDMVVRLPDTPEVIERFKNKDKK